MASFKREELDEMNKTLINYVEEFIKYDVQITEKGAGKTAAARKARQEAEERARQSPDDLFYI